MDKLYCKKIDRDLLVEKYVEGKMDTEERQEFEQHLRECPVHAQAVVLEKALHRGISEFARSEIRTRLKRSIQKREDIRFYIVRYAAILFLVVITPLLYYIINSMYRSGMKTAIHTDSAFPWLIKIKGRTN